jgi:thioesterase domain-containing protein
VKIPAADTLQLREEADGVRIPLEPNLNDKGCLFAGSIYAGAVLAAYRTAEKLVAERGLSGDLMAKAASISYLKRVVSDGQAVATLCGEPACKPNGNHVLSMTVVVSDAEGACCAELTTEFVLLKARKREGAARA